MFWFFFILFDVSSSHSSYQDSPVCAKIELNSDLFYYWAEIQT